MTGSEIISGLTGALFMGVNLLSSSRMAARLVKRPSTGHSGLSVFFALKLFVLLAVAWGLMKWTPIQPFFFGLGIAICSIGFSVLATLRIRKTIPTA